MQRVALFFCLAFVVLTLLMPACKHDPIVGGGPIDPIDTTDNPIDTTPVVTMPCSPDTVYFQNQVLPLLVSNCSKPTCHNTEDHEKNVVLVSYESLMGTVDGVKNQDWSKNELMKVLVLNDADERMPPAPNPKLTFDQVNLIAKWIAQGAQNNRCDENAAGCDTSAVKFSTFVQPLVQGKCQGCHSGTAPAGGVKLTDYAGVKAVAQSGKLLSVITHPTNWMPKNGQKLDDCSIQKIRAWVNAGAANN